MGASAQSGFYQTEWMKSEEHLKNFLNANGVSTDQLGMGTAKSLSHLYHELQSQACFLELQHKDSTDLSGKTQPTVLRVVEPVFIRLCWHSRVLVQEAQQMTDGRMRPRKMLMAEKKEPSDGGGLLAVVIRALNEELGLDRDKLKQDGVLKYRTDAYHFELEQINSPSYPGLTSMYRTHHIQVDILDTGLDLFKHCGLPDCTDFQTSEQSELGTTTHFWRWYDTAKALQEKVVKFPPAVLSSNTILDSDGGAGEASEQGWRALPASEFAKEDDLAGLLQRAGINTFAYGVGKAKTVAALLKEISKGDSTLEWQEQTSSIRRIAEPLFIQFRWGDRVLVEVEQRFLDGKTRARNMLLAEKKSPEDEDVPAAAFRALKEELDLPAHLPALDRLARFMSESYCCMAEHMESSSYPGLSCVYVTHYCAVQLLDAGAPHFEGLGLLASEFETQESDKTNCWKWTPFQEARLAKVKGFPNMPNQQQQKDGPDQSNNAEETVTYEPMANPPLDVGSLRVLLEVGGVNVSAWGPFWAESLKSLAREIQNDASTLEKNTGTGKIRRVLQSHLVQLTTSEGCSSSDSESLDLMLSDQPSPQDETETEQFAPKEEAMSLAKSAFGIEEARGLVCWRADLACFEVMFADTSSYPGLPCCHQTRLVQFDQNAGLPEDAGSRSSVFGKKNCAASPGEMLAGKSSDEQPQQRLSTTRLSSNEVPNRGMGSLLSMDDGQAMQNRGSLVSAVDPVFRPKRRLLSGQLTSLQRDLRFGTVANEKLQAAPAPANQAVACACKIMLIRNINPLNATFQCRFEIFMEWVDNAATGWPQGEVTAEQKQQLTIPEIALQNTLNTNLEVHSQPEVVNSQVGHVACTVLYQALVQMELNMRLFPFDEQRLMLVLGLRARKDRSRALVCQFCSYDQNIKLAEWRLSNSFMLTDRPDGRARVQFGVVISRAYRYYLVNVLGTLVAIATMSLLGFLLAPQVPFDRLRFGVAVLFAQTTFRLAIEGRLPKVSYATAFDQYAICCQLLVIAIMVGNVVSNWLELKASNVLDTSLAVTLSVVWVAGNAAFARRIAWRRRIQHKELERPSDRNCQSKEEQSGPDYSEAAEEQLQLMQQGLRCSMRRSCGSDPDTIPAAERVVTVAIKVMMIHDIDPAAATYECKFLVTLEWLQDEAKGFPEDKQLTNEQLAGFNFPKIDVQNKVELSLEEGPFGFVKDSSTGKLNVTLRYHAKMQSRLNLRLFPFDSQLLPLTLSMPAEKDQNRAFVHRTCHLTHAAKHLDEWFVDGLMTSTDFAEDCPQATLQICIRRRYMYFVVSMMLVLFGISSLVCTVFVIEGGSGYVHQGKILGPLLMTLLAFKFVIANSKIPKASYTTIFDRILLSCEALFFASIFLVSITLLLSWHPLTASSAATFQTYASLTLLALWILNGMHIAVRALSKTNALAAGQTPSQRVQTENFQAEFRCLVSRQSLSDVTLDASLQPDTSCVLIRVNILQLHSVNPATATFACEFTATVSWLNDDAKELASGTILDDKKLGELHLPKLRVQNALNSTAKVSKGRILDQTHGHITCEVHFKASVLMDFRLERFPFDTQRLVVFLQMAHPLDIHRQLVLEGCTAAPNAIKVTEWSISEPFAAASRHEGVAQGVFGITIHRDSQYYVTTLVSLVIWSLFVLTTYTLDFDEYHDRGKICVGVLLLQNAQKLAMMGKLPRIARVTDFDLVALNSLGLNFGVACSAAFCHAMGRIRPAGLDRDQIARLDQLFGLGLFFIWAALNLRVVLRMCRAASVARQLEPGMLPTDLGGVRNGEEMVLPSTAPIRSLSKELVHLQQNPGEEHNAETEGTLVTLRSNPVANAPLSDVTNRSAPDLVTETISLSVKVWMVSNIDGGTFECKFHAFLEWVSPAAIGLPENSRISSKNEIEGFIRPKLAVKNAIAVIREECSDAEVKNSKTGRVLCHIQYHVKVFQRLDLRFFPFDCQRLSVDLQVSGVGSTLSLVMDCFDADDQTQYLDGWHLSAMALQSDGTGQGARMLLLVERQSRFYIINVLIVYFLITTIMFSFFLIRPDKFAKRMVDALKIVLAQTVFRFQMGPRLPTPKRWTRFDIYMVSCQAICCFIAALFIASAVLSDDPDKACFVQTLENCALAVLATLWALWNAIFMVRARCAKKEIQRQISGVKNSPPQFPTHRASEDSGSRGSRGSREKTSRDSATSPSEGAGRNSGTTSGTGSGRLQDLRMGTSRRSSFSSAGHRPQSQRPWDIQSTSTGASTVEDAPQVVSAAFRIWLVRNVDLVTATFECKFRVFLEWLDKAAVGLPKGKKAKLPVPLVTITNAVQSQVIDKSSAPEVVNPETGHLAVQILYRATLKIDQEVHQFPFDCQWLAINMSLREEGTDCARTLTFQYCEVDDQLQLDEWEVWKTPAFSTMTKQDAASIQDTVMCGILIRRNSRYYVVNILALLGLISSLVFTVYVLDVKLFWERFEVLLGIFPMTIIFKMTAQGKLPRVGYMTKFDIYAGSCQFLFFAVVAETILMPAAVTMHNRLTACKPPYDDEAAFNVMRDIEAGVVPSLFVIWLAWNVYFTVQSIRVQRVDPIEAVRSPVPIQLAEDIPSSHGCPGTPGSTTSSTLVTRGLSRQMTSLALMELSNAGDAGPPCPFYNSTSDSEPPLSPLVPRGSF